MAIKAIDHKLAVFGPTVTVPDMPDQPADNYRFEPAALSIFPQTDETDMARVESSCPKTGRDSKACDTPDHRNCPNNYR